MSEDKSNPRNLRKKAARAERIQRQRQHDGRSRRDRSGDLEPLTVKEQDPVLLSAYPALRAFHAPQRERTSQPIPAADRAVVLARREARKLAA